MVKSFKCLTFTFLLAWFADNIFLRIVHSKADSKLRTAVQSKEFGDLTFMKQHFIGELLHASLKQCDAIKNVG